MRAGEAPDAAPGNAEAGENLLGTLENFAGEITALAQNSSTQRDIRHANFGSEVKHQWRLTPSSATHRRTKPSPTPFARAWKPQASAAGSRRATSHREFPTAQAIIDAIHAARVMILVFSSHANTSGQVPKEVERAVSNGLPIIPFRIEDVAPGKSLDYFIGSVHWLDAMTPPMEQHLDALAATVRKLVPIPIATRGPYLRDAVSRAATDSSPPCNESGAEAFEFKNVVHWRSVAGPRRSRCDADAQRRWIVVRSGAVSAR